MSQTEEYKRRLRRINEMLNDMVFKLGFEPLDALMQLGEWAKQRNDEWDKAHTEIQEELHGKKGAGSKTS